MFTSMRAVTIILAILLLAIQYPLWFGKGGGLRVWELNSQLVDVEMHNEELKARNARLASEVKSLQEGNEAIEERARSDMAMMKRNEVFVQMLRANAPMPSAEKETAASEKSQKR